MQGSNVRRLRSLELDDDANLREFEASVLPDFIDADAAPLADPRLIVVGGQMGSGKSTAIERIRNDQDDRRPLVTIMPDELLNYVPGYDRAAREDSIKAQRDVGSTPQWWLLWLYERALAARADIVFEVAAGDLETLRRIGQKARDIGYRTELKVLAAHEIESWHGVVGRYHRELCAGKVPRFVERENHEASYHTWPGTLAALDSREILFDRIELLDVEGGHLKAWVSGEPSRMVEEFILARAASLRPDKLASIVKSWETLVKSPELETALPEMLFLADQRAAEEAKGDPARTTVFRPGGGHDPEIVGKWVESVHSAANDALGEMLTDWFAARMKVFKASVVEKGRAFEASAPALESNKTMTHDMESGGSFDFDMR